MISPSIDPETDPVNPAPRRRFPEGFALAAAAIFGAAIVLAGLLALRSLDARSDPAVEASETASPAPRPDADSDAEVSPDAGDDDPPVEEDSSDETVPPEADEPGPAVVTLECPAGIAAEICDAAEFVQQARGRPFKTFPVVEVLADAEFDAELLADFAEYEDELDIEGATLQALGLLPPDVTLSESFRSALEVGVVGFYDPETGRLVVRGVEMNLYAQLVLVHELTHAFDDQWFDLDRAELEADDLDREDDYGFSAVVEGNASRVESAWRAQLGEDDERQLSSEELNSLSVEDLQVYMNLPAVLQELQISPYIDGEIFVDSLAAVGGEEAVDEALTTPPTSSEEILHPSVDRSTDIEVEIESPPAKGEIIDEGRLGELLIGIWLGLSPAEGWGGDRHVTWLEGDRTCIRVDLVGDEEIETAELANAAGRWAEADVEVRIVEELTLNGVPAVRVTGCTR